MSATDMYLLFESATGYALFQKLEFEEIGGEEQIVQEGVMDASKFQRMVALKAFLPFTTAEDALEQVNAVSRGEATEMLTNFLEMNLPKKKKKYQLGVADAEIGRSLSDKFPCTTSDVIREMFRGCRLHFVKLIKDLTELDVGKARLGLAHAYSRSAMQLDPNRQDKPIINSIALLDGLDKNINTFAMRVKEWYAWHFPEMTKIVTDNVVYCKAALVIRLRDDYVEKKGSDEELTAVTGSEEVTAELTKALNMSMGQDIKEIDMVNIANWASQVVKLANMRETLTAYLEKKLDVVSPNLKTLIGERVAARLISHAGSLTNLAKYPSSTVQILGAEKALFRALKTKGNTPKYGLIFHTTFIGRAAKKNKGRISRYVANKASLAARIDCFSDVHTNIYGEKMRDQVEERMRFLEGGEAPRKNADVMREAMDEVAAANEKPKKEKKSKKEKKAKAENENAENEDPQTEKRKREEPEAEEAPKKKKKKEKKAKSE